ncbi:uncharacterized protein Tco025E_07481 [Trypanosoma conorhini]|uniref:RING-CH-type domain-containing protein n=1 Tax=Trypanosoma conorhini TaxID=83891 RepID=A0A422NN74_9TRYP|nr:uncharacterized protein Tco025E_07481 [Trypanosoma conorhini]RNF06933.1 hypothetical protein Tco025E_07481 [Trypanosoma conorhini]
MGRGCCVALALALALLSLLARGEAALTEQSHGEAAPRSPWRPPVAFGTLTATPASSAVVAAAAPVQQQPPQQSRTAPVQELGRMQEYSYRVASMNSVVPVTVEAGSRHQLEFTGEADNVVSIVAQLLDNRYDNSVPSSNCFGLYVNVEVQVKDADEEAAGGNREEPPRQQSTPPSAWATFWNSMATILDSSAFCDLLPTVMLRVEPTREATQYYFIVSARHGYTLPLYNYTCQMRLFFTQRPAAEMARVQNVFALGLPLAFLLLTGPFVLWRIDLIPGYLTDIDVISWMWFLPCILRDALIKAAVGCGTVLWGAYRKRRARERQRRLEERHRRLMEEAERLPSMFHGPPPPPPPPPPPFQRQAQQEAFAAADVSPGPSGGSNSTTNSKAHSSTSNNNNNNNGNNSGGGGCQGEAERHGPVAVHVRQPPPHPVPTLAPTTAAAAVEAEGGGGGGDDDDVDASLRQKHTEEEKRKLLQSSGELEAKQQVDGEASSPANARLAASVAQYPPGAREKGAAAAAAVGPREMLETAAPCVVHVHAAAEAPVDSVDGLAAGGSSNHRKRASGGARVFLYKEEEEEEENVCRICRDGAEEEKLVSACECTGSVRWVHRTCLDRWRLESAKRNIRNVNRCEICKKPFSIPIRRRTLLWQSSRHFLLAITLAVSTVVLFAALSVLLRNTLGSISCQAPWRSVSYATMFNLDGIILTLFGYFMLTLLATFSFALVYSRWHVREETEAYVQEFQVLPEFWTRRNTAKVVAVYVIGLGQALCLGYLLKLFVYRTSSVAWNWEASPSIGAVLYLMLLSFAVSVVRGGRDFIRTQTARSARDVVVETADETQQEQQQGGGEAATVAAAATGENADSHGQAPTGEGPRATSEAVAVPPHLRPIRAVEYCPRRPVERPR